MFYSSIEQIIKAAKKAKNKTTSEYFEQIKESAYKHDNEYVYAYASILREYMGRKKNENVLVLNNIFNLKLNLLFFMLKLVRFLSNQGGCYD